MILLVYILFFISALLELLLVSFQPSKIYRIVIGSLTTVLIMFSASVLFIDKVSIASTILLVASFFRVLNIGRVLEARMHSNELKRRTLRTTTVLLSVSAVLIYLYIATERYPSLSATLSSLSIIQLIIALVLFLSVFITRRVYRYREVRLSQDEKLPTVSVCIPARNETQDLPACIESVLKSSYPKLEILVLDDCSHDKTPEIIKKYAHDGVRFIKGQEPDENWVAKNAAFDKLTDEAKGDVLLFIGVDVRLKPHTISELVGQMGDKDMISVLPQRDSGSEGSFFIQPLRYWWELGLFRYMTNRPPVLSTCWMAKKNFLDSIGGFEGFRKSVKPEAKLARLASQRNMYSFLIANTTVGVISIKGPKEQYDTALRIRYPNLKRRPELVFALLIVESIVFLLPAFVVAGSFFTDQTQVTLEAGLAIALIMLANAEVYKLAQTKFWLVGLFTAPLLVIADSIVLFKSMWGYEFGKIEWKERNICLPLLQVEKELPKID